MGIIDRLQHGWNAFLNRAPTNSISGYDSYGYVNRPDRVRMTRGNERTIITSIINRIAIDVSEVNIKHCRLDENERYIETISSGLNSCLTLEANLDQSGSAFLQDIVMSMFDEGCVAVVPIDTNINPHLSNSYDILSMRVGKIVEWRPKDVKVRLYNEQTGHKQEIYVPKKICAIIENPLFAVCNESNSTLQRLKRKLSLLDVTDEQTASGKLDLIIQLPYVIKTEARRKEAEQRRKDIESQLSGTKYGIAYTDGTERITQLNRSIENQLMGQIEFLTNQLFAQLGITQSVLDGTADEKTMLNYQNRCVKPIVTAITSEFKRKFLTKTARTQGQTIVAFRDPFSLVPIDNIADIADKFTRNEILTKNEVRQIIGMKPSDDPKADRLLNSNIAHQEDEIMDPTLNDPNLSETIEAPTELTEERINEIFNSFTDEEKEVVYAIAGQIIEEKGGNQNV